MRFLKEILKEKNLKLILPYLVGLIVLVAGVFGVAVDPESVTSFFMLLAGLVASVMGILSNNDKSGDNGGDEGEE